MTKILGLPCDRNGRALRPLTRKDEEFLIRKAKSGDIAARNVMVVSNEGLIGMVASRMKYPRVFHADLIQDGALGLIRALEKFDLDRRLKFSTYAVFWLRHRLTRCLNKSIKHMKKMPRDAAGSLTEFVDPADLEQFESAGDLEADVVLEDMRRCVVRAAEVIKRETDDSRIDIFLEHRFFATKRISNRALAKVLKMSVEGARQYERRVVSRITELIEGMQDVF